MPESATGAGVSRVDAPAIADIIAQGGQLDLAALYAFSRTLSRAQDEVPILQAAVSGARRMLEATSAAFFTLNSTTDAVWVRCMALDTIDPYINFVSDIHLKLTHGGVVQTAVQDGKALHFGLGAGDELKPRALVGAWQESRAMLVPLPAQPGGACPGVFVFTFKGAQPVNVRLAMADEIARQTADALRTARLLEQTQHQAAELKLLEQIGRALAQRLSMADTLNELVRNVNKVVSVKYASIFVYDPASQGIRTRASTLPGPAMEINIPVGAQSIVATCLREGVPQIATDMLNDPRCNQVLNKRFNTGSGICVPLGPSGFRFGVMMVNNPEPSSFSADDVRRLEQLAQLASAAIERARIHEEMCQRADELILLNEVGRLLVENPLLESTLQRIADLVCRNFQAAGAGFLLLSDQGDALYAHGVSGEVSEAMRGTRVPLSLDGITTQAFKQNQTLVVEDALTDPRVNSMLHAVIPGIRAAVVIPLTGRKGPVGVFGLWKKHPCHFLSRDLQCLSGVARLAAAAVRRDELGRALHKSEERLQEIVDGLHAMIFSLDLDGRILSFNAGAERISGKRREDVLGKTLSAVVSTDSAEQARIAGIIAKAFQDGDATKETVLIWTTSSGDERQIHFSYSFLHGEDGVRSGMVCLGIDITEQALLEAQLLQAQKMESVGSLAGGMAHDFNNLLGGIIGLCTLAKAGSNDPALTDTLAKIESAAHRGADLTSKLLTFARKSVLQPQPVAIAELINETTGLLAGMLPQNITVVTRLADDLPAVHGDPTQLQQVLLNLCVNARDAMPHGGSLTILAEPLFETDADNNSLRRSGVLLEVSDTGTGMTDEVQQHLFEPFFTTKEAGRGTGLGLSVVFGIVRSHGGRISVRSQIGVGTTFSIKLPSEQRTSASGLRTAVPDEKTRRPAGTITVLLVDDDQIMRDTVGQLLGSAGFTVVPATGGIDAIKQLDGAPPLRPSVVVLDVVMPGLAGVKLLQEVQRRLPGVPILLMSGYSGDRTVEDMLAAGARELLQKPFTIDALTGAIQRAVAQTK